MMAHSLKHASPHPRSAYAVSEQSRRLNVDLYLLQPQVLTMNGQDDDHRPPSGVIPSSSGEQTSDASQPPCRLKPEELFQQAAALLIDRRRAALAAGIQQQAPSFPSSSIRPSPGPGGAPPTYGESQHQQPQFSAQFFNPAQTTPQSTQQVVPSTTAPINLDEVYQYIADLTVSSKREKALLELSRRREMVPDLAPLLWHSFGVITAILQEIISIYSHLTPPNLTSVGSNRVCNALALLQCVASHPDTRQSFLNAHIPLFLYPFLNTISMSRPFEYLRLTSLGVIGALVKTEIISLCLRIMEMGSELSKTVATFIVQKILLDDLGLRYVCATAERFYALSSVLGGMVASLVGAPSSRLLKHIVKCYLRLANNPRAKEALKKCIPPALKDGSLLGCMKDDATTRQNLLTLLAVVDPKAAQQLLESSAATANELGGGSNQPKLPLLQPPPPPQQQQQPPQQQQSLQQSKLPPTQQQQLHHQQQQQLRQALQQTLQHHQQQQALQQNLFQNAAGTMFASQQQQPQQQQQQQQPNYTTPAAAVVAAAAAAIQNASASRGGNGTLDAATVQAITAAIKAVSGNPEALNPSTLGLQNDMYTG